LLSQIRKIARRYKSQYEELLKEVLELRAARERDAAALAAAAAAQEMSLERQEQLREEGRKEVENKIKEAESRHSDVVKELTEQVHAVNIH
jgi:hypothetical protein